MTKILFFNIGDSFKASGGHLKAVAEIEDFASIYF